MSELADRPLTAAQIKRHLAEHDLRLGVDQDLGCRALEQHEAARGWVVVARRVKTWAVALSVAVTLGLCPSPRVGMPTAAAQQGTDYRIEVKDSQGRIEREAIIRLCDYQRAAIDDQHRIVILCWCRQAGKDFTTALKAVLDAMESGQNWYIVSLTQRQALATAKKAQMHAKAISGVLPQIREEKHSYTSGGQAFTVTSYGVKLKNGAEIVALPGKDPDALAGLTGNVIFTEMALFPNNGIDHWRVVFPLSTRGFKVWAISTPRGPQTKFSELRRNAAGEYSVHNVTIHDAVRGGLELRNHLGETITPEQLERIYADPQGWSREYLCIEGEDHEPLMDWQWINACGADERCEVRTITGRPGMTRDQFRDQFDHGPAQSWFRDMRKRMKGQPVIGWDIAVKGDLSVVAYGEKLGELVILRGLLIMKGVDDFEYQEELVTRAMETGATGVGDATGLGMEACQRIGRRFGEARWAGLNFAGGNKTDLFMQLRDVVQRARLWIDRTLETVRYDLHSLAKDAIGIAGRLRVLTLQNPLLSASHADIATAIALMIDAASGTEAVMAPRSYSDAELGRQTGVTGGYMEGLL